MASKTPTEKQELRKTIVQKFMTNYRPADKMVNPPPGSVIVPSNSENVFEYVDEDPILYNDRKFHYLEDDPLSRIETDVDFSSNVKLYLYLYRIEENFEDPFLQVYFVKKDKTYTLPHKEILPPVQAADEQEETHPFFYNASVFYEELTGETHAEAVKKYKGFIETQDELGNKCVIAVFGPVDNITPDETAIWSIVDEFWFKTRILDTPVKEFIVKAISDHPSLLCIKDHDGNPTVVPYLLYLCDKDKNAFYLEGEARDEVSYEIFHKEKGHEIFNSTYLFSTEPFEFNNISNIKRFAVVIKDPLYLFNYDFPVTEYKEVDINQTVCFYENSREMWSVKDDNLFSLL